MFDGLPGIFLTGTVMLFIAVTGGSAVRLRGKLVKFRGSLVGII